MLDARSRAGRRVLHKRDRPYPSGRPWTHVAAGHPGRDPAAQPRREQAITVERLVAGARRWRDLVDYHWYVGWRTAEPHRQQVVPQPRVHLAAERTAGCWCTASAASRSSAP